VFHRYAMQPWTQDRRPGMTMGPYGVHHERTQTWWPMVTAYQPIPLAVIQQLDPIYVDIPQSTTELLRLQQRMAEGRLNRDGQNQNKVRLLLEDGTPYPQEGHSSSAILRWTRQRVPSFCVW
jgi:hypothetical protein